MLRKQGCDNNILPMERFVVLYHRFARALKAKAFLRNRKMSWERGYICDSSTVLYCFSTEEIARTKSEIIQGISRLVASGLDKRVDSAVDSVTDVLPINAGVY